MLNCAGYDFGSSKKRTKPVWRAAAGYTRQLKITHRQFFVPDLNIQPLTFSKGPMPSLVGQMSKIVFLKHKCNKILILGGAQHFRAMKKGKIGGKL